MDLTVVECTFFSRALGTLSRIDHMLGHKTSPVKFKKTEIVVGIFPDHSGMKLEVNNKREAEKYTNMWR